MNDCLLEVQIEAVARNEAALLESFNANLAVVTPEESSFLGISLRA